MATLLSLPTELLFCIVEELEDPTGCFNLAITCTTAWQILASKVEEHRKLFARYGSVTLSPQGDSIWELFHTYVHNKSIAKYVRKFSVPAERRLYFDKELWYYDQDPTTAVHPPAVLPPAEYCDEFRQELEDFVYFRYPPLPLRNEITLGEEDEKEVFRKGSDGPVLAMFVTFLSNLKTLEYCAYGEEGWLEQAMIRIVLSYMHPQTPDVTWLDQKDLPFQHLTHVSITHWDTENHAKWLWCLIFLSIPSVRTFTGFMLGGDTSERFWGSDYFNATLPDSNVESLTLSQCGLGPDKLEVILRQVPKMKTFKYSHGSYTVAYEGYDPKGIIKLLCEEPHFTTLEHLAMVKSESADVVFNSDEPVSLAAFHKLKSLQCTLDPFIQQKNYGNEDEVSQSQAEKDEVFDITTILPKSLEILELLAVQPAERQEFHSVMDLVKNAVSTLPYLKRLAVGCYGCFWRNSANSWGTCQCAELREICKGRGLEFVELDIFEQDFGSFRPEF